MDYYQTFQRVFWVNFETVYNFIAFAFCDMSPKRMINLNLSSQMFISAFFCISALFVEDIANAGRNALLTALMNLFFAMGAFYVVNKRQDAGSIGQAIGAGGIMVFLSLTTAIYWGGLSRCERVPEQIEGYTCENKAAMRSICAFSVLMFLLQLHFTALLSSYKTHILAEAQQYSELPTAADCDDSDFSNEGELKPYAIKKPPSGGSGSGLNILV